MNQRIQYIAFWALIACCWLPGIIQQLPDSTFASWKSFERLKGYQKPKKLPSLTLKNWFNTTNGTFQAELESGIIERLRARPPLVRLNNQVKFDLYDRINAKYIYYGQNGYFFSQRDVHAYQGSDFIGKSRIRKLTQRLSCVRDTLKSRGTELLFVIAPSKVRFYPDQIPFHLVGRPRRQGNTETFIRWLEHYDVPHLEYSNYLQQIRDSVSYPIYAKGGYHWTAYGAFLSADTLFRKMEDLLERPLPQLKLTQLQKTVIPGERDNDIGDAANLLYQEFADTLAYPEFIAQWKGEEPQEKPRVLTIGDSYYSEMINIGLPKLAFAQDWQFWYYYRQIRNKSGNTKTFVKEIPSLTEELESWDIVMLVITELNLTAKSWKFIDQAYQSYFPPGCKCQTE